MIKLRRSMTKNPYLNALAAAAYIGIVGIVINFAATNKLGSNSVLAPVALISLFTLSAGTMGYIFLTHPVMYYLDGKKKEAVNLFLKTLGTFALLTALFFTYLFLK